MTIQMKKKHRVLLVPEEALYIAFRLPRILCCAGCEVDLLSTRTHPLRHSRYISKSITTESTETLFDAIVEELRNPNSRYRTIIVVPENQVRRLVATGDVNLLKRWQPGTVDHLSRELVLSKFGLEAAQVHKNMSIPLSKVCHSEDEVLEFGDHAGWPIICKPSDRAAGLGVVKLSSRDAINELSEPFPLLVQKFIEGQRGVTDMICAQGRPLAWLTSYSTRKARGEFGASTARLFKPMPELKPLIYEVAKLTRLEGFCGFDWIEESGTGRHYLIEIHPRSIPALRPGSGSDDSVVWIFPVRWPRGWREQPIPSPLRFNPTKPPSTPITFHPISHAVSGNGTGPDSSPGCRDAEGHMTCSRSTIRFYSSTGFYPGS